MEPKIKWLLACASINFIFFYTWYSHITAPLNWLFYATGCLLPAFFGAMAVSISINLLTQKTKIPIILYAVFPLLLVNVFYFALRLAEAANPN
jgi:CDP-diglyceride synthetase